MPRRQPGTVNDEPATYSATYPATAVKALPMRLCMQSDYRSDAIWMRFGCGSDTVRMQSRYG